MIFYVKTQIGKKNHREKEKNPLITRFAEAVCQSLSAGVF